MYRLLAIIAANALGIYAAARFISGFEFTGSYLALALAAIVFALINWTVRPLVKFIAGPIIFLTFGLFVIVINMAMLWLLDLIIPSLVISNLTALILATLLIGVINLLILPTRK